MNQRCSKCYRLELHGTNPIVNESVVVLSDHIDSWDVGVGAMDDGGGSFISWKAIQYLKMMNYRPTRTLRKIYKQNHPATEI